MLEEVWMKVCWFVVVFEVQFWWVVMVASVCALVVRVPLALVVGMCLLVKWVEVL